MATGALTTTAVDVGVAALVQGSDGSFWGIGGSSLLHFTAAGLPTSGGHQFSAGEGRPSALLRASTGTLWGMTIGGGEHGRGTVFTFDGNVTVTTVHSFTGDDGVDPHSLIEGIDGKLYGLAGGALFGLDPATNALAIAANLPVAGPYRPSGLLATRDGEVWGTACRGGSDDLGAVFTIDALGRVTTVHSFDGNDGRCPAARLMEARDGTLWGTTGGGERRTGGPSSSSTGRTRR